MAKIVIGDLPENADLDRRAMKAIIGGSRLRGAAPSRAVHADRLAELVDRLHETRPKASPRRPAPSILFK